MRHGCIRHRNSASLSRSVLRLTVTMIVLLGAWQALVTLTGVPHFILPGPLAVATTVAARADFLIYHAWVTGAEILLGLTLGALLGAVAALMIAAAAPARRWLLPVLIASQAIPVFAIAPLLMLWFGYGIGPKVVMAALIIFFPVTATFYDGLRRTEPGWLDLAHVMQATPLAVLLRIRLPAALPACASGLRVATATAPIGAVVGEWVGASAGLGHVMLQANARAQTDLMFAALAVLSVMAIALYTAMDRLLRCALPWQTDHIAP